MANKRLQAARDFHQKWLSSRGLTLKQIEGRRDDRVVKSKLPDYRTSENAPLGNGFARAGFVNTPMANRFKESPTVRAEIERKASRIAPAYSKGNAQYISDGDDPKHLGKKL